MRTYQPAGSGELRHQGQPSADAALGHPLLDLASNDYLGFSRHPAVLAAAAEELAASGLGAGASRLVSGTRPIHGQLEQKLAKWLGRDTVLLFPSGFQANLAALVALADRHTLVLADRHCHHSLLLGVRASGARLQRFAPNDLDDLERRLVGAHQAPAGPPRRVLVVSETLFSMEGTSPHVAAMEALCRRFEALLLLDEAHALGVLGPGGRGLAWGLKGVTLISGTFGKAFGSGGAFLAADGDLGEWLLQHCGGFRYTTALAPALAAGAQAALGLLIAQPQLSAELLGLSGRWRDALEASGWPRPPGDGPILPLLVGGDGAALDLQQRLEHAGLLGVAIRPPTVPEGSSRLRLVVRHGLPPSTLETLLAALGPGPLIAAIDSTTPAVCAFDAMTATRTATAVGSSEATTAISGATGTSSTTETSPVTAAANITTHLPLRADTALCTCDATTASSATPTTSATIEASEAIDPSTSGSTSDSTITASSITPAPASPANPSTPLRADLSTKGPGQVSEPPAEIIAMHGWAGDGGHWQAWQQAATSRGWRLQVGERGYGQRMAQLPQWSSRGRKWLLCHSLGVHLVPPELLAASDAVVLLASFGRFVPPGPEGRSLRIALAGMAAELQETGDERQSALRAQQLLRRFLSKIQAPGLGDGAGDDGLPGPADQPIGALGRDRLRRDLELLTRLTALPPCFPRQVPVLLVEATDDAIVHPAARDRLRQDLPEARVRVLEGPGHAMRHPALIPMVFDWLEDGAT